MLAVCLLAATTGCRAIDFYTPSLQAPVPPELEPPRELSKVSLPAYRIGPPDVVRLEVLRLAPRPSYRIDTRDVLQVRVATTLLKQPFDDYFSVDNDGVVTLGPVYGVVRVEGLTMVEAAAAIARALRPVLRSPQVTVQLARSAAAQDISHDYEVGPDGVIHVSQFGAVHLAGKTLAEARLAIQDHLAQYFDSPRVGVGMVKFNSQSYYVITAMAAGSENARRFPIMGNETVLDAIGQLQGLSQVSSKMMWIARPASGGCGREQILPIDWNAIAAGGETKTNYQLLPGDRLYVVDDKLVAMDNYVGLLANPLLQMVNVLSDGTSMIYNTQTVGRSYNLTRKQ
jgi:polysaccharide biosynthesis/export protein